MFVQKLIDNVNNIYMARLSLSKFIPLPVIVRSACFEIINRV